MSALHSLLWWEAPPLHLTTPQAQRLARRLLSRVPFNACQTVALLRLSVSWRPLTRRDRQILGCLAALADQGGWRGLV
ncbi:hypothetical protein D9599_25755 [Roseomonas sp. KE2513]|nr:hypothetical protein [Roseomonas sp. KE2513]